MNATTPREHAPLPDPQEIAKTYAEVAQRASKLLTSHIQRQAKKGISAPGDELGIAQAFMDMTSKLLANASADEPGVGLFLALAAFDAAFHGP